MTQEIPKKPGSDQDSRNLNRRKFLRQFWLSTVATVGMGAFGTFPIEKKESDANIVKHLKDLQEGVNYQVKKEASEGGYLDTIGETTLFLLGEHFLSGYLERLEKTSSFKFGNSNTELFNEVLEGRQLEEFITSVVNAPFIEELAFRAIPSGLVDEILGPGMHMLDVGVPISFLFGAIHNLKPDYSFDTEYIPVYQVLGGIFFWYLMRKDKGGFTA